VTQENKQKVRKLVEVLEGQGNYALAAALLSADYRGHLPFGEVDGRDKYLSTTKMLRTAFPDMDVRLTQLVAEDDMVAIRLVVSGTHLGEFQGLPPTGREIQMNGAAFFRLAGGKIVEGWSFANLFALIQELGAIAI
jgi:steroid delta-isomerase-like uncharacterized protein